MRKPVQIEARRVFDHERRLLERVEILRRAIVHILRIRIRAGRQLDLRARDAEKTERVAVGQRRASSVFTTS